MKQIRHSVFETNSSSTHSITIQKGKVKGDTSWDIPFNEKIDILSKPIRFDETFNDEGSKLTHIIALLAAHYENEYSEEDISENDINGLMDSEISKQIGWVCDVVKKERNSVLVFKSESKCFPYMDSVFDDNDYASDILDVDLYDESKFKAYVKDVIFNPEVVIIDDENEY